MNENSGLKKNVEISTREEYVDAFFSLIPDAMTYMTSQNLQVAINSLEKVLNKVKQDEEEKRQRIASEKSEKEALKRFEAIKKAEEKRRQEEERREKGESSY